ncbi:MAG: PaaI family thioesterase [Clostridiales bacterium]|nr:PaaI family thioesterase [Clostridiales bacterium]
MEKDRTRGQKLLEKHIEKTIYENNVEQKNLINEMMKSCSIECSFEEKTITFGFPVQPWQANRVGNMHGGLICTAFDLTLAALARFFARENFAPTISLDVKYVRPISVGDMLLVKAKATSTGRRITQLTCEAYSKESEKLIATGASVYLNVDTMKEKAKQ